MRLKFALLLLLPYFLLAQNSPTETQNASQDAIVPPEQIEEQLLSAEAKFKRAKKMFNPWYAGPLVTPSASMMPPGDANIQPYLFIRGNYAAFNQERTSISLPHNSYQWQLLVPSQIGVTDSTDIAISLSTEANWQDHHSGGGFGDITATYGFKILSETVYIPKFKFTVAETFPTGRYKNLNSTGLNGTGGGSYQTTFGFATGKVIWWSYPYPMNTRLFIGYTIQTTVDVSNYNTYGGGIGTKGRVRPGNILTADFGYELSFSERWVFAMDVVYVAQEQTKFHGHAGVTKAGLPAAVGSPYNDNLSLAPALEYNFNDVLSLLWGVQFSVYGRSSLNFINGQFSVEYMW